MDKTKFQNLLTSEMLCARRGLGIFLYEIFTNECNFKNCTHGVLHQTL
jgi:hypothetical protein